MRYNVPPYDPFGDRGEDYYHPGNESAKLLVHIGFTYIDIARLFGIMNRQADPYDAKLLTKFAVVELLSMDVHINGLVRLVMTGKAGFPITPEERERVKTLSSAYTRARKPHKQSLSELRNTIAAHRDNQLDLVAVAKIWDGVEAETVTQIVRTVPPLYEELKKLGIYCWTKSEDTKEGRVTAVVRPLVIDGITFEGSDEETSG